MFTKAKRINEMEALGRVLSDYFGRVAPILHDAKPAPIAVIASDDLHEVFITVKDGQYVLYCDDATSTSVPQSKVLAAVGSDLADVPWSLIMALDILSGDKQVEGDFPRAIAYKQDLVRLTSDSAALSELYRSYTELLCSLWWENPPKKTHQMTSLLNNLRKMNMDVEYARLRLLEAEAYEIRVDEGDLRVTHSNIKEQLKMGLDALDGWETTEAVEIKKLLKKAKKAYKAKYLEK